MHARHAAAHMPLMLAAADVACHVITLTPLATPPDTMKYYADATPFFAAVLRCFHY